MLGSLSSHPRARLAPSVAVILMALTGCSDKVSKVDAAAVDQARHKVSAALAKCALFPAQAVFNLRIDDVTRFPKHAASDVWVATVKGATRFHPDWGDETDPRRVDRYYGIPFNVIDGSGSDAVWTRFSFAASDAAPDESDCAMSSGKGWIIQRNCQSVSAPVFPLPSGVVLNEHGRCDDPAACGDHHVLVLESGTCRLWEGYHGYQAGGQWTFGSTAAWDLNSMRMRPAGWTSADAAGFPILPLIARAAEASSGEIKHALRVTFTGEVLDRNPVWPASHAAGSVHPGAIPLGAALRLKSSFVIPPDWSTQAKAVAVAMQRYGLYVADLGSNLYVQGEPSAQWDSAAVKQLKSLSMADFEFVDMGAITRDPRFDVTSYQGAW